MKIVNSISGGKSSAYVAIHYPSDYYIFSLIRVSDPLLKFPDDVYRKKVEDKLQMDFIGTVEMDDIIYTVFDLEQYLGKEIKWVSGETFEDLISFKSDFLPNLTARYCTTELKVRPIFHYLYEQKALPVITQLGFRFGEENRLLKKLNKLNERGFEEFKFTVSKNKRGQNKWQTIDFSRPSAPLIDDCINRSDVNRYFRDKPIRFAHMNNCVGCWWRPEPLLHKMSNVDPKKYDWFIREEQKRKGNWKKDITYEQIKNANFTLELEFDDFSPCDTGYCGV